MSEIKARFYSRAAYGRLSPADKRLAAAMKTWRETGGLTATKSASLIGVSATCWRDVETGRKFALPDFAVAIEGLIKTPVVAPAAAAVVVPTENYGAQINGLRAALSSCMKRLAALETALGVETATEKMTAARHPSAPAPVQP